jgi:Cd2+/Zn2+-exporting ATPase
MDCSSCLSSIATHLRRIDGVHRVEGSVLNRTLTVTVDDARVAPGHVRREIAGLGYTAETVGGAPSRAPNPWLGAQARRVYAALGLALVGALTWIAAADVVLFSSSRYVIGAHGAWFALSALVGGWNFFPKGFAAAKRLSLDMNSLMSVAIVGALLLGEFFEAASIAVLFSVAELLETYSVDRARASIESLMDLAPERAVVVRGGVEVTVAASDLAAGDELVVRPGDRIAADGTILHGTSAVDQSPITGESLPVEKAPGDAVFSGTINTAGHLRVRVDRPASESALAKIVRLVEEADATKTRSERFVERFARYYTPTVTVAAIAIAVGPPVLLGAPATLWITRGLTLLVIACPCALVISTPVAVVSGLTAAARHGVLIKGGVFLEAVGSVTAFAFDKTGTLTVGRPTVRAVVAGDERDMLARAAALERHSEHPLGRAIVEEADERGIEHTALEVTGFVAIAGEGARAVIDGQEHVIGRPSLFPGERVPAALRGGQHSLVGLSRGGALLGWIALADRQRDGAAEAVAGLRAEGIRRIVMLTGDNRETAEAIRATVGLDEARAELLPVDKLAFLNDLEREHGGVAMVGDGVNDAPALAAATVGIAMGAAGSDAALQTADVALMGDDLRRLPYLVRLSRRARAVIRQNIAAAIAIKAILAIGVPLGYVSLITAVVVGDMGVSLAVTLNALRLGRVGD